MPCRIHLFYQFKQVPTVFQFFVRIFYPGSAIDCINQLLANRGRVSTVPKQLFSSSKIIKQNGCFNWIYLTVVSNGLRFIRTANDSIGVCTLV